MNSVSLTSKNQITLPIALVRQAALNKGTRFSARLENGAIVLQPQTDIRTTIKDIQADMRLLVKKPLSDNELQKALHNWA